MKNLFVIMLLLTGVVAKAQLPANTFISRNFTGNTKAQWILLDSPLVNFVGTSLFNARYAGTQFVKIGGGDTAFYFGAGGNLWFRSLLDRDTLSLSNRINLKLNISDTIGQWLSQASRLVDTMYRVNDSTVGYTIKGNPYTFQILGRTSGGGGGGSGTVTSVALSMPSAFTVSGSPVTSSGTLSVSGAGTTLQYIRGNGTLATADSGMIPNFYLKVRGLLTGTSPITFNQTTGAIGINDANTSGTKGAATFNSGSFSDNGSGTISLLDIVSAGSCVNCDITFDSKGRATSFTSGTPPQFVNAPGAGDTLSILDTLKRLNPGFGITHVVTNYNITQKIDTSVIATQYDLTQIPSATLNNIGSGFRAVATPAGNIKTFFGNNTLTIDSSSNSNALTFKVDTSIIATQYDLTQLASVSLNNIGAGFRWLATPGGNFKSVSNGYGIKWDSTSTANTLTAKVDTIELASKWGLEDLVWKRKGVVLSPSASAPDLNNFQEPSVIREGNPIILTSETTVFKMWWTRGWNTVGICYAESVDGRNWTQYSGNPIIADYSRSSIIKDGSTYVIYAVPGVTGPRVDRFTSTDGVTFSLINTGVITQGTAGQWNDGGVFNSWVIKDGSTYRMLVDGLSNTTQSYADGYYTSSDGITWTPYASNPVTYITGAYFTKIGSEFWLWGHAAPPGTVLLPTDAYRAHSSDMINWTYDPIPYNSTFHRYTDDEGADSSRGQVADLNLLTVGDSVYMFYSATRDGDQQSGKLQIKLAVAEMPFANLIATRENADRFRTFETSNRDIYYPFGNVGFGASKVRPTFPVDVETNIRSDAGFVSWNQSVGTADAALIGYNLYHRVVSPIWRLIDTTNHGMGIQYGSNDIRVMTTITVNTSSPTITVLGTFRRTDTTFSWIGRTLLGNGATDDGVSVLNVNGPIKFNGNLTELGLINGLRVWKGANAGGDNAAVGNGLAASTTSDRNAVIGMQSLFSITTGSFNSALGAYTLQNLTSGNFNTGAGDVTLGSLLTGSSNSAFGRASFNPLQDGDGNSGLGTNSGRSVVHGSNNTAIGLAAMYTDGTTASTDVTGSVALGYNAQVTQNNSGVLGGLDANGFGMRWGIGKTAPLAWLHLPRGKTTAGFAPLKIDSGALLTTPEAYAIEVDGDSIYWTNRALDRIALNRTGSGSVTTLYTGDGTLAANRTVTGSNNDLTFATMDQVRINSNQFAFSKNDGTRIYSTWIGASSANAWQFGYTPGGVGSFTQGVGLYVDTLNNVGLGDNTLSTSPLYTNGNSTLVMWGLQSVNSNYYKVSTISSNTTINNLNYNFIMVDATSGNVTITLAAASSCFGSQMGLDLVFKRIDNSGNSVTIQRAGSDTIDGATSFTLTTQWESKNLRATSTSTWNIY